MKYSKCLLPLLLLTAFATQAQKPLQGWRYTGQANMGLVAGAGNPDAQFQTLQGLRKGSWMLAAGLGYDHYTLPAFPLTAHVRRSFSGMYHRPYVFAEGGPAIAHRSGQWKETLWNGGQRFDMQVGWLAETGLGWQIRTGRSTSIHAALAYSVRGHRFTEREPLFTWRSSVMPTDEDNFLTVDNRLRMQRLVLKLGFQW